MHTSLHQSTSGAARHVDSHHSLLTFCSVPFWLGRQPAGLLAGLLAAGVTEGLAAGLSLGHMHTPLHQSASGVERHVLSHQSSATFWSVAGSTAHFCPSTAPPACSARAAARSLAASACAQAERSTTARAVGRRSGICAQPASCQTCTVRAMKRANCWPLEMWMTRNPNRAIDRRRGPFFSSGPPSIVNPRHRCF